MTLGIVLKTGQKILSVKGRNVKGEDVDVPKGRTHGLKGGV